MKIAVLGAAGQLGRSLCVRLPGEVIRLGRADIDLAQSSSLSAILTKLQPNLVINCAAYNFVDRAESEPEAAFAVNTWGVRHLAHACRDLECVLVQVSTDHVFGLDGQRRTPFSDGDAPGPVNVYGLSKLGGEYLVRSLCPRHFIVRTCGLYGVRGAGGKGSNFVDTMLRLATRNEPLRVVDDQVCTPTYVADLADAMVSLLDTNAYGIHHVTNAGACSWFQFARAIFEQSGVSVDLTAVRSAEYGAAAQRPAYSVLENTCVVPPPRPWQEALAAYLEARRAAGPPVVG